MPSYYRRDDNTNMTIGFGWAVPNCAVTYYVQPSLELATVYADPNGATQISNPQFSDGLGHTVAYMAAGFYTITFSGPQIQTLTLPDQEVGGLGSGSGSTVEVFSGTPSGTIDGVNRVFTLTNNGTDLTSAPTQAQVWKNFPLVPGDPAGYTLSGVTITYAVAPQPGDSLFASGFTVVSGSGPGGNTVGNEQVAGSGTSLTLANAPNPAADLMLFQRVSNAFPGVLLIQGKDYTLSGNAITITNSNLNITAGTVFAWYSY